MSDEQTTEESAPTPTPEKPARRRAGGKGQPVDVTGRYIFPARKEA